MSKNTDDFFRRCKELIDQRQIDYAQPEINLNRIAKSWSEYLGFFVSPYDVCVMMTMLKLSRLCNGYHQDSLEDAACYMALASKLSETRIED
jgi:hypothetical protein